MASDLTGGSTLQTERTEGPGGFVGPYKLLSQIGEGGFGLVYEAEQTHPVKRRVALKVIKSAWIPEAFVARFEAERQVLALMDHPHIAKVFGAGASEDGRPYFVMELVKGEPIDTYCAKNRLSINDRLQLFVQVCEAVQHAHSKGIIHRDLKPGNVLVSTQDDRPFAKVIDFGIAKALGGRVGDRTLYTEQGMLIGTPLYMSPEQAEGSADIDTRSDIYALGVILYQLLTSTTPIEADSMRQAAYGDVQRLIREVDPPRPSTRLDKSADALRHAANECQMTPQRLRNAVRGELDWIVMKALEKERGRRYETANGFAMDIRRFLEGEPVLAAPPSALYRSRKFVRRHKTVVGAAALILLSVLGGLFAAVWQARIAQEQTRIAEGRAAELEQMAEFQEQMFERIDPAVAGQTLRQGVLESFEQGLRQGGVPADDVAAQVEAFDAHWQRVNATDEARNLIDEIFLEPAVAAIDAQFKDQPLVDAGLRQVMADRYLYFGQYDKALPLQQQALAIRKQVLGDDHPDTLRSVNSLASMLYGQLKFVEAEPLYRDALARRRRVLGDDHPDTLSSIGALHRLLAAQGRSDEAEPLFRELMNQGRRAVGEQQSGALESLESLGRESGLTWMWEVLVKDSPKEVESLLRDALDRRRRTLGEDHSDTLSVKMKLAQLFAMQDKHLEAEAACRDVLDRRRRVLGEDHPDTLEAISELAFLLLIQDRWDEQEPLYREKLSRQRRVLGEEHPDTLSAIDDLAMTLNKLDRLDEAEALYRESLPGHRQVFGDHHIYTLNALSRLADLLQRQGKLDEAEPLYREELAGTQRVLGEDHSRALRDLSELGVFLLKRGKLDESEQLIRQGWARRTRVLGEDHRDTLISMLALARLLNEKGEHQQVLELLQPAEIKLRDAFAESEPHRLGQGLTQLGRAHAALGQWALAEQRLLEAQATLLEHPGSDPQDYRRSVVALAELHTQRNLAEPSTAWSAKAAEWRAVLTKLDEEDRAPSK